MCKEKWNTNAIKIVISLITIPISSIIICINFYKVIPIKIIIYSVPNHQSEKANIFFIHPSMAYNPTSGFLGA